MADKNEMQSSIGDRDNESGLKPDTKTDVVEEMHPTNEERALDVGESGQFAPGGRYNELGATKTRRIDLDEQVDSALSSEEK